MRCLGGVLRCALSAERGWGGGEPPRTFCRDALQTTVAQASGASPQDPASTRPLPTRPPARPSRRRSMEEASVLCDRIGIFVGKRPFIVPPQA